MDQLGQKNPNSYEKEGTKWRLQFYISLTVCHIISPYYREGEKEAEIAQIAHTILTQYIN